MPSTSLWTIPNAVTSYRIVIAVPVMGLIVKSTPTSLLVALILMITAEISDGLDGILARRYGQVSSVGKILDPMADSLYRVSVFTAFVANHWMPLWMFLIILWRDVSVSYFRIVAEQYSGTMGARQSGKWKAIAQGTAQITVVLAYIAFSGGVPLAMDWALWGILFVATAITLYSLLDYGIAVFDAIQSARETGNGV